MTTLLEIRGLNTYYGESHILRDVDLTVNAGEMVCLIGRNGVGKTTLLKSLIGLLRPRRGEVVFNADPLDRQAPYQRARAGVGYVPQGREIIPQLTVEENLMLGMEALPGGLARNRRIDPFVYELFPVLQEFLPRKAVTSVVVSSSNWRLPGPCSASPSCCCSMSPPRGFSRTSFRTSSRR